MSDVRESLASTKKGATEAAPFVSRNKREFLFLKHNQQRVDNGRDDKEEAQDDVDYQ
jgi:hypothetical protein